MKNKSSINSTYNATLSNQPLFNRSQVSTRKINRVWSQKFDKSFQTKSNLSIIASL